MIRVIVCSEVQLLHQALARALDPDRAIEVVGAAVDEAQLRTVLREKRPDVVVVDLDMPDARTAIHALVCEYSAKVVVFSVPETEHHIVECLEMGVAGYVVRRGSLEDLELAVQGAACGELYCPARISALMSQRLARTSSGRGFGLQRGSLTSREKEIVDLIDLGLSNKQIAARLGIRVSTVKNHVHSILEKCQVNRRGEAAALLRGRTSTAPRVN